MRTIVRIVVERRKAEFVAHRRVAPGERLEGGRIEGDALGRRRGGRLGAVGEGVREEGARGARDSKENSPRRLAAGNA